jgi:hypothetical protein
MTVATASTAPGSSPIAPVFRPANPPTAAPSGGSSSQTARPSSPANPPPTASASSFPTKPGNAGFMGVSRGAAIGLHWRPKQRVENHRYPKVTAPGTYWIEHSGGFQLINRTPSKYLAHYTQENIRKLEKQYGKKKSPRRRTGKRGGNSA